MLHVSRNVGLQGNILLVQGLRALEDRLPPGWKVGEPQPAPPPVDSVVQVAAPDGTTGSIALKARARLAPKGVQSLVDDARTAGLQVPLAVLSRYLSSSTRERLRARGTSFLDLTGNIWLVLASPGLFIETQGATEDPDRLERPARSLRGAKAGRIVRALVDRRLPPGVRELAAMTEIDAGYVSRVLKLLDSEALITRGKRGRIEIVDWPALLRRWAQEAPLEARGEARTYLEPRGLSSLVDRLARSEERYTVTGTLAVTGYTRVAPPRLAVIWMRDAVEAAGRLGLRPAETGANVLLVEPGDESVFKGAAQRDSVWYAAPSQVAADLLTSPGRGPAEGDELIEWMRTNEEAWRR